MLVAVFGDAHAHAEALDAVIAAAESAGVQQLWSLGDMIGRGPDPEHAVKLTRERCAVALVGNHDYGATGSVDPLRFGEPGSAAVRSIELAAQRLTEADIDWLRARRPAARRDGVQCWHGSPRNAVHEYVGAGNAAACLAVQRAELGLVAHTHQAAAWQQTPTGARRARIAPGEPLDISTGRWLLNPGAVAAALVGCAGRPGRRRGLLAAARPEGPYRDLAPRTLRTGAGALTRTGARAR
jgi:predicted phosphodiesterase